jgi:protein SCO1
MSLPRAGTSVSRRQWLQSAAITGLALAAPPMIPRVQAAGHGRVDPPLRVPDLALTLHDGQKTSLPRLLEEHATALQLMFTSCSSTCPIQGAIFRRVQELLVDPAARAIQLVSLSVDPERDDPAALARWLRRFDARPGWVAAAPRREDVERLRTFGGAGKSAADNHSTRVQIADRRARLVWRTAELPDAKGVARILERV